MCTSIAFNYLAVQTLHAQYHVYTILQSLQPQTVRLQFE